MSVGMALWIALGALAFTSRSLADGDNVSSLPRDAAAGSLPFQATEASQTGEPVEAVTSDELFELVHAGEQYIILKEHIDMSASNEAARHAVNIFLSPPGNVAIMGDCHASVQPPFAVDKPLLPSQCVINLGVSAATFLLSNSTSGERTTLLDNLVIYRKHTEGASLPAVSSAGGRLAIYRSSIRSNQFAAPAVKLENARALFEDVEFSKNVARQGGAVAMWQSTLLARNATFSQNQADGPADSKREGGAIWASGSVLHLESCAINRNYAAARGGALYLQGPTHATLSGVTLSSNRAGGDGDGVFLSATNAGRNTLHLNGTTFVGHSTDIYAEGAVANDVAITVAGGGTPAGGLRTGGREGGLWLREAGAAGVLAAPPAGLAGGRTLMSGDEEWLVGALRVMQQRTVAADDDGDTSATATWVLPVILVVITAAMLAAIALAVRTGRRCDSCLNFGTLATKDDAPQSVISGELSDCPDSDFDATLPMEARHSLIPPPETIRPPRSTWSGPMTIHETAVLDSAALADLARSMKGDDRSGGTEWPRGKPRRGGLADKLFISLPPMSPDQVHWMLQEGRDSEASTEGGSARRIRRMPSAPPGFLEILAGEDSEFAAAAAAQIPAARQNSGGRSMGQADGHAALKVQSYSSTVPSSRGSLIQSRDSNFEASGSAHRPHPPPTFSQWRTGGHTCVPALPEDAAGGEGSFQLPSLDFARSGLTPSAAWPRMEAVSSARSRGAPSDSDGSRGVLATSRSIGGPRSGRSHGVTTDNEEVDDGGSISVAFPGPLSARSSLPPSASASAAIARAARTPSRGGAAAAAAAAALAAATRGSSPRSVSPHSPDISDTVSVTFPSVRPAAAVRSPDHCTASTPAHRSSLSGLIHAPWPRSGSSCPEESVSVNLTMPPYCLAPPPPSLAPLPHMHSVPLDPNHGPLRDLASPMHSPFLPSSPMHGSPMHTALATLPDAALIALHESLNGSLARSAHGSPLSTLEVNMPLPPDEQFHLIHAQTMLRTADDMSQLSDDMAGSISDDGEYV
eukprot:jgi/Ulvmu1/12441/UM009_0093.1